MAACPAASRETRIAFGFVPQADLVTRNPDPQLWSLTKTNATVATVEPRTETDALDIGKGDEFASNVFDVSISTGVPIEKYCSSEFMAWLFCFGLGTATSAAAGTGFKYDAHPQDPVVDCINLKAVTFAEQIRTGANAVLDRALLSLVVNDFEITMESGPGRANCRVTANMLGTGLTVQPSGVIMPALTAEHLLNAGGTSVLTFNGIDYLGGDFISMVFRWNNNVRADTGYYPGSGMNGPFQTRGRMEFGTREVTLSFVARAEAGSREYLNLINGTEGPTTITVKGAAIDASNWHSMTISCPRTRLAAATNGDADGLVSVQCDVTILKPPTGPLLTLSATTTKQGILGLP